MKSKLLAIVVAIAVIAVMLVTACAQPTPTPAPTSSPSPAPSPTATIAPMSITFSGVWPITSAQGVQSEWIMNEITKRSGGAITFTKHWNSSLAEPAGHLGLLQSGVAPLINNSPHYNPGFFPDADSTHSVPFSPQDAELVLKAYRANRTNFPQWESLYTKQNAKPLAFTVWGQYNILSKVPVNNLADLKGKKVGIIGKYFPTVAESAGMVAVGGAAADRYMNLQSGLIDMEILGIDLQASLKNYEVTKYYVIIGLGSFSAGGLYLNLDFFNKLDPAVQKIFVQTGLDSEPVHAKYVNDVYAKYVALFKEKGLTVSELPAADVAQWASQVPDTPAMEAQLFVDAGLPGYEIMQGYLKQCETLGWKWPRQWAVKK